MEFHNFLFTQVSVIGPHLYLQCIIWLKTDRNEECTKVNQALSPFTPHSAYIKLLTYWHPAFTSLPQSAVVKAALVSQLIRN